jgi:FAD/FMN-containing dehydrogenase
VGATTNEHAHAIEQIVYDALPAFGGAITAEHGIGQHKKTYLAEQKSIGEQQVMQRLRKALDPARLLNPDVMF